MRIVVALGGNALLERGEKPDASTQLERAKAAARALAPSFSASSTKLPRSGYPASSSTAPVSFSVCAMSLTSIQIGPPSSPTVSPGIVSCVRSTCTAPVTPMRSAIVLA